MSKSLFLVVKGGVNDAVAEAIELDIDLYMLQRGGFDTTYAYAKVEDNERVADWFVRDHGKAAPFVAGTLLWWGYSPTEIEE